MSCISARVSGSSAPNGSSISSIAGSAASARASPTRCRCPPESWCGNRRRKLLRLQPHRVSNSWLRRSRSSRGRPSASSTSAHIALHREVRKQPRLLDHVAHAAPQRDQVRLAHAPARAPAPRRRSAPPSGSRCAAASSFPTRSAPASPSSCPLPPPAKSRPAAAVPPRVAKPTSRNSIAALIARIQCRGETAPLLGSNLCPKRKSLASHARLFLQPATGFSSSGRIPFSHHNHLKASRHNRRPAASASPASAQAAARTSAVTRYKCDPSGSIAIVRAPRFVATFCTTV